MPSVSRANWSKPRPLKRKGRPNLYLPSAPTNKEQVAFRPNGFVAQTRSIQIDESGLHSGEKEVIVSGRYG